MSKLDKMTALAERAKTKESKKFQMAEAYLETSPAGLPASASLVNDAQVASAIPQPHADFRAETTGTDHLVIEALIEKVHDNPDNARHVYSPEKVAEYAASMRANGQKVAANAVRHPHRPNEYILIDGHYRKRSLLSAGIPTIRLSLEKPKGRLQMYLLSRLLNHERSEQTPIDDALSWQKLLNDQVVKDAQTLAETIGISPSKLNKTMAFLKLPTALLDKVKERPDRVSALAGYELHLLTNVLPIEECLSILDKVMAGELSARGMEAIRLQKEKQSTRKPKEMSRQYKINSTYATGHIKDWETGKITFEIDIKDNEKRHAFLSELKGKFNIS